MIPDVNVLVAASRSDHAHFRIAAAWLAQARKDCAAGASGLRLLPMVTASFLRLVTNPKIFAEPTPTMIAVEFIDSILVTPHADMPALGAEWPLLRQWCIEKNLKGNALPDAWLAAAVVQLGGHLVTFDAGFSALLLSRQVTLLRTA